MYVSVLFMNAFPSFPYDLHWEYTAATYPYKTLVGDVFFCQSECDNDILCNGYSIDESNDGCFLSRCTTPTSVPTCFTCKFASKKSTTSTVYCLPTSTTVPMTSTTPITATTPTTDTTPTAQMPTEATETGTMTTLTSTASATPVTNEVIPNIFNNTVCHCVCREVNQTLQESIEKRRTKMTLNKSELSSNIRKLYSVPDYRMSSKMIGSVAIIILVAAGMLPILSDMSSVLSLKSKRKFKKITD